MNHMLLLARIMTFGHESLMSGFQVSWGHSHSPGLSSQAGTEPGSPPVLLHSRTHLPRVVRTQVIFRTVPIPAVTALQEMSPSDLFSGVEGSHGALVEITGAPRGVRGFGGPLSFP